MAVPEPKRLPLCRSFPLCISNLNFMKLDFRMARTWKNTKKNSTRSSHFLSCLSKQVHDLISRVMFRTVVLITVRRVFCCFLLLLLPFLLFEYFSENVSMVVMVYCCCRCSFISP